MYGNNVVVYTYLSATSILRIYVVIVLIISIAELRFYCIGYAELEFMYMGIPHMNAEVSFCINNASSVAEVEINIIRITR
jgi:hypothetical protein